MVSRVSRVLANLITIQHGKLGLHLCIPGESHNRYKPHLLEYKLKSAHFVYIICQSSKGINCPYDLSPDQELDAGEFYVAIDGRFIFE